MILTVAQAAAAVIRLQGDRAVRLRV